MNPVAPALSFGVMTEGDARVVSDENDGTMAVGGNLSFGNYQLANSTAGSFVVPGDSRPTALVVGGRVDFAGSVPGSRLQVLSQGYAKVGDLTGTFVRDTDDNGAAANTRILPRDDYDAFPRVELTVRQPPANVGPASVVNFAAAFAEFRSTASALAGCENTVVLRTPEGAVLPRPVPPGSNAVVSLTSGVTNVLTISATDLNNIDTLTFADRPTSTTPLLINVDTSGVGDALDWNAPNFSGIGGEEARYILLNFPTANRLTLTAAARTVEGSIYAPNAAFSDRSAANTEGSVITRTLDHQGGEIHYFPFSASLTCNGGGDAGIAVVKSSSTGLISAVGQQVPYFFEVVNTGGVRLTDVSVLDVQTPPSSNAGLGPITCPATVLDPGASITCTATYTVTQADLDNGGVTDTATARGFPAGSQTPILSEPDSLTIPADQPEAGISVVKSSTTVAITRVGQEVSYRYEAVNTGGVTLTGVTINDTLLPPASRSNLTAITCGPGDVPNGSVTLAPGESVECRATYTVPAADFAEAVLLDVATATGTPPSGPPVVSGPSAQEVPILHPAVAITKAATPTTVSAAGEVVTYRFTVTDTGNTELTGVTVEETAFSGSGRPSAITCDATALAPGESATCTATYTVTEADVAAGRITNTAVAVGTPPTVPGQPAPGPVRSEPASAAVTVRGNGAIVIEKSAEPAEVHRVGQQVRYLFRVTNTGSVTLTGVTVIDTLAPPADPARLGPITCGPDATPNGGVTLAPGRSVTCAAIYTVAKADAAGECLT
ncbi:collagen-binding domain-containing protein, partial [Micromonospora sp. NPDC005313]|uniref:DUF7507 domain-containing protein n=1 Tax=Micromonospora sp. NPDC005313 TaxID=3154296 RepID=UPI0033B57E96